MPELPEVEVICQGLLPHLLHRTFLSVTCSGKQLRAPIPCKAMQTFLPGTEITDISRRAKYIIIKTNHGAALIIHLGMTGNMGIFKTDSPARKHDHIHWELNDNTVLRFNDTRRFGSVIFLPDKHSTGKIKQFFSKTGPEPFSRKCSAIYLRERAKGKKLGIKQFLMDSHVVAGIGNIYANETLFHSKIHPLRAAASLSDKEWKRLLTVIRKTLSHAIECGGSTISDFLGASGDGGYFQINFCVYGKNGEKCVQCSDTITKMSIGGRASFFCPTCQKSEE